MQNRPQNIGEQTTTRSLTGQRLAVGLLITGAVAFGASVALGLIALPRRGGPPGATPLRPNQLYAGAPNIVWENSQVNLYFSRNDLGLALYGLYDQRFTPYNNSGNSNVNSDPSPVTAFTIQPIPGVTAFTIFPIPSNAPLKVGFVTNVSVTLPARTFVLETDQGAVTLCLPETTTPAGGSRDYYFDINGTPYNDAQLRQRAMGQTCTQILAKAFVPTTVNSATASRRIDETPHGLVVFNRGNHVGVIDGSTWTPNNDPVPPTVHPLILVLGGGNATDVVNVPTLTVTLNHDTNQTLQLCFPGKQGATVVPFYAFYYDKNGQPYEDVLLQEPVTCALPTRGTPAQEVAP